MPETKVLKFKEGRYEGEVNSAGDPEGEGCLEYPGNDEFLRQIYEGHEIERTPQARLMNSKSEWNTPSMPECVVTRLSER